MKNRLIALFLTTVLILAPFAVFPVQAESNAAPCDETVERVKNEILTGNITDTQDVLDVALSQRYTTPTTYHMRSINGTAPTEDESLKISQVIEATQNADGSQSGVLAVTGLLVVDENGRSVSASEYEYYRMSDNTQEGNLDSYHIYATQTIYVTFCFYDSEFDTATLEIDHMKVSLIYEGTHRASRMRQIYADEADYIGYDTITEYQTWILDPAPTTYTFTPTRSRPLPIGSTQLQGLAEIRYGNTTMTIATIFPTDSYQFNKDFGILLEGWS